MKTQPALNYLVPLIAALALLAAATGIFTPAAGSQVAFATARGATVTLWGQGLYRFDTPIGASGFMAGDIITRVLAIPILLAAFAAYRRGDLRGACSWRARWRISCTSTLRWASAPPITTCSWFIP